MYYMHTYIRTYGTRLRYVYIRICTRDACDWHCVYLYLYMHIYVRIYEETKEKTERKEQNNESGIPDADV